jgi:type I restriction enzyme S subunit
MKKKSLRDLCELISVQIDPNDHATKTYIGLEHIATGRFLRIGGGRASDIQSSKFIFQKDDVLYSKLRPYLDKAILADCEGVCTTELLVLRAKPGIDPRFLLCVLHSPDFIQHALSGVTGAHHPRTSWHRIAEFIIPDLLIQNQLSISTIMWQIQDAIMISEKKQTILENLFKTLLHKLMTDEIQYSELDLSALRSADIIGTSI